MKNAIVNPKRSVLLYLFFPALFFISGQAEAHDKVVVVPLKAPGIKFQQSCPGEENLISIDTNGDITCATKRCPGNGPVVGIDKNGRLICGAKQVFITNAPYQGNLGGLKGADFICNVLASQANLSGSYKAWLSENNNSPGNRFIKSSWPYVLVDGTVVAQNWNDLVDGSIAGSINLDQNGDSRLGTVWTGTKTDGSAYSSTDQCSTWRSISASDYGLVGHNDRFLEDYQWTSYSTFSCNSTSRLYCFEQ
ncbi:MAG: DUF1554 domain-containing protein [Bacteroidetes bacterium]|nr:DUF1554 domain-containing protein [Bacteroidota bacterium]